ncbi:glycosyl transferase family 2 [Actinocorallia herbida]|uniref:Glycosyl transferase family 2 n=1 Tax=Actinocorallia herbida TaxID=58109 RepID=A0A3N1CN37_9ACTN|nr:glycosyltransferase family 2 protein [Actinocorallia herbida]ROO82736.1 glycosyl transferase family 2 [Actinocorallia herbida]
MTLVTVALPTRDGIGRMESAVASVLAQDHPDLELLILDNASTDGTEEYCRDLADADPRVRYHRHPENLGILGNFGSAPPLARGELLRWISDDDRLEPGSVSRGVAEFAKDDRLVLVTTGISYTTDGVTATAEYTGGSLGAVDAVTRFTAWLRLLNESHLLIDPLYGLIRRDVLLRLPRRNLLREDEVFAARLALAGPWAHVPEVLGHRNWRSESTRQVARRLGVPAWQAYCATTLECLELLRRLPEAELPPAAALRARAAVAGLFLGRQRGAFARRLRRLGRTVRR